MPTRIDPAIIEAAFEDYQKGLTYREIAEKHKVHITTLVRYFVRKKGARRAEWRDADPLDDALQIAPVKDNSPYGLLMQYYKRS